MGFYNHSRIFQDLLGTPQGRLGCVDTKQLVESGSLFSVIQGLFGGMFLENNERVHHPE